MVAARVSEHFDRGAIREGAPDVSLRLLRDVFSLGEAASSADSGHNQSFRWALQLEEEPMLIVRVGCPICINGLIRIRRCSDGKSLVLMCDECESVWLDPKHISAEESVDVRPPSFAVAQLGVSVAGPLARWPAGPRMTKPARGERTCVNPARRSSIASVAPRPEADPKPNSHQAPSSMQSIPWRYVGEAADARVAALAKPRANAELAKALTEGLELECFHQQARDGDPAYHRAVFCGRVDEMLFDWFFNASSGYRGAFFQSAAAGTQANSELLEQLSPFLARWAEERGFDDGLDLPRFHGRLMA